MERKSKKPTTAKAPSAKAKVEGPQKPTWKKISRGTLYPFPNQMNRRVKPNETISATEDEIARYREHFELVKDGTGPYKVKEPAPQKVVPLVRREKEEYELIPTGQGLYDVHSPSGKKMNDKGLKREEAEALKESLEKETVEE